MLNIREGYKQGLIIIDPRKSRQQIVNFMPSLSTMKSNEEVPANEDSGINTIKSSTVLRPELSSYNKDRYSSQESMGARYSTIQERLTMH